MTAPSPFAVLNELRDEHRAATRTRQTSPAPPRVPDAASGPVVITDPTAYASTALDTHSREVAQAPEGQRNDRLNAAAFSLGRLVAAELLTEDAVVERLREAATNAGLGQREALATIRSGLRGGAGNPLAWTRPAPKATPATPAAPTQPDELLAAEVRAQRARRAAKRLLDQAEADEAFIDPGTGYRLDEFTAQPDDADAWLIEPVLPLGANVTLTAPYKTGKTTTIVNLIRSLADGHKFLDRWPVADNRTVGNVALWDYEMTPRQHRRWFQAARIEHSDRVYVRHLRGKSYRLDSDLGMTRAIDWLTEHRIGVWLIDPFARAYLGDENDNGAVTAWTDRLDRIKDAAGVHTLVMPVHTGRREAAPGDERARGATRLDDWPDVRWLLARGGDTRYFRATGRDVEVAEVGLRLVDGLRLIGDLPGRAQAAMDRDLSKVLTVLSPHGEGAGMTATAVREEFGWSGGTVSKRLNALADAGRIVRVGKRFWAPRVADWHRKDLDN